MKCTDCEGKATITWDGTWLCLSCENKRLAIIEKRRAKALRDHKEDKEMK